jgi:hypothetical protein
MTISDTDLLNAEFDLGLAAGLRTALDILTRETARQEHRAQAATSGNPM